LIRLFQILMVSQD